MDFESKLIRLTSNLRIRYMDECDRADFTLFLRSWLRQVPHLLDIDLHVLLEGVGLLYKDFGYYVPTQAWWECCTTTQGGVDSTPWVGLLWWLDRWEENPSEAVIVGTTMWCHLGQFQARQVQTFKFEFVGKVWERFQKTPIPNPTLVRLLRLCDGPPLWTHPFILDWKKYSLKNPRGSMP